MSKYFGTSGYVLVYAELIRVARGRTVTTYQTIAKLGGLPEHGNAMGKAVGMMLGEITEQELREGRPMISAACVGVSGSPGQGFYGLAEYLGKFDPKSDQPEAFWCQELEATYQAWEGR